MFVGYFHCVHIVFSMLCSVVFFGISVIAVLHYRGCGVFVEVCVFICIVYRIRLVVFDNTVVC